MDTERKPEPLQFTDKPATRGPAGTTITTATGSNGVSLIQASGGHAGTGDLMDGFAQPHTRGRCSEPDGNESDRKSRGRC